MKIIKKETDISDIIKIKHQRRSIGLLHFKYREDINFSKWYSLTENLVIRAFGQKANQVIQLKSLWNDTLSEQDTDFWGAKKSETREIKDKFQNLLTVFISELELDVKLEQKVKTTTRKGILINIKNTQTINQDVDITVEIKNIIENIKQNEPDPQKANEAEIKLKEFEAEIKSKNPAWSKIKDILIWLLNFSRDAFIQVLPILLQKYGLL